MKKTIVELAVSAFTLTSAFARDISEKKHLVGLNGGFSLNTMGLQKGTEYGDAKNTIKPGGVFGINYEYRAPKVFGLEIGANYANKGSQQKIKEDELNRSFIRLNFHSVEVPIIAKFYMGKNKVFNINVGGYASYAFNVQSRTKIDFKDNTIKDIDDRENNLLSKDKNPKVDGEYLFRPFDAGVNVGFEFVSKSGFGVGARVQQGLVDFTNPDFIADDKKKVLHTNAIFYALFKI